ncbi:glycosyltransferase family 4 protein [Patescibacteria group bacterium]|nr:glycosyltransferase family 4 protein [Patescibacteria group bacterium]
MKILHTVKLYSPLCGGMYEVVRQLSEWLAAQGHSVTVASITIPKEKKSELTCSPVHVAEFDIKGTYARGLSGEIEKYRRFVQDGDFDIVTNFAAQQAMTDALLPILPSIYAKKVFVPTGFNGLYLKEYREYFKHMPEWMRQYDMNVIISNEQRDMQFAKLHGITNTTIISNGASRKEFEQHIPFSLREKLSIPKNNLLILHVGSHTGFKGHSRAIEIFSQANTGPAALLIVGNPSLSGCSEQCARLAKAHNNSKVFKKENKNIIIKQLTRVEIIAAYREADLFLFPSNIEGGASIVLFECMAAPLPFLTTDVGSAKEIILQGGGGMLLPTEKDVPPEDRVRDKFKYGIKKVFELFDIGTFHSNRGFVRAEVAGSAIILEKLCRDKKQREKLGSAGHQAWIEKFTWEKIAEQYENLYDELLEQKRPSQNNKQKENNN